MPEVAAQPQGFEEKLAAAVPPPAVTPEENVLNRPAATVGGRAIEGGITIPLSTVIGWSLKTYTSMPEDIVLACTAISMYVLANAAHWWRDIRWNGTMSYLARQKAGE